LISVNHPNGDRAFSWRSRIAPDIASALAGMARKQPTDRALAFAQ
jgi:hypothetical protein